MVVPTEGQSLKRLSENPALALFYLQRASGVLLAALLVIHLATIGYAVQGELTVSEIIDRVRSNRLWSVFYFLFIVIALAHASIGLRNVLTEMLNIPKRAVDAAAAAYLIAALYLGFGAMQAIW